MIKASLFDKRTSLSLPHSGAIEVNHEPLGGVEGQAVGILDASHPGPELRADEGRSGVGRIHMQPHLLFFACVREQSWVILVLAGLVWPGLVWRDLVWSCLVLASSGCFDVVLCCVGNGGICLGINYSVSNKTKRDE